MKIKIGWLLVSVWVLTSCGTARTGRTAKSAKDEGASSR